MTSVKMQWNFSQRYSEQIHRKLQTIVDVGLVMSLWGQPATTLSGGGSATDETCK